MVASAEAVKFPELVFGIAGPMGVDIEAIAKSLAEELRRVRYDAHTIRVTNAMMAYPADIPSHEGSDYNALMTHKIDYGNALCRKHDPAVLARIAIREIRGKRAAIDLAKRQAALAGGPQTGGEQAVEGGEDTDIPIPSNTAYIIRQLKRPHEVALLRKVYGRQFVLISAYGSAEARKRRIAERIRNSASTLIPSSGISGLAEKLMERDESEGDEDSGQQLRETFHLADVFVDGILKTEMDAKINRFIQAFFGKSDITPSKAEYGMYAAKSASLRSADLSRQVGAAIFSDDGELITQGCNEVPKALGGTYWDLEDPDYRDVKIGYDPNVSERKQIMRDLFERLQGDGLLSEKAIALGSPAEMVEKTTSKGKDGVSDGPLVGARILDLTEFGRVVHAEMCAICDAARLGRSVKHATLYCTTFPCHNCAKHVIASGIKRVVYMEPYPKSLAKDLHANEISVEDEVSDRVSFIPFLGISPYRYRDIFQKGKRKTKDGNSLAYIFDDPMPMLDSAIPTYPEVELTSISELFLTFTDAVPGIQDNLIGNEREVGEVVEAKGGDTSTK